MVVELLIISTLILPFAGEAANSKDKSFVESLTVDIPFDGLGLIGFPAADAISPVYTMWISLVVMYLGMRQLSRVTPVKSSH